MLRCELRLFEARIATYARNKFSSCKNWSRSDVYILQNQNFWATSWTIFYPMQLRCNSQVDCDAALCIRVRLHACVNACVASEIQTYYLHVPNRTKSLLKLMMLKNRCKNVHSCEMKNGHGRKRNEKIESFVWNSLWKLYNVAYLLNNVCTI